VLDAAADRIPATENSGAIAWYLEMIVFDAHPLLARHETEAFAECIAM
jgi:hypothetical protein